MIKIDMNMPNSCMECKLTYVDECGDFYICGITHKSVVDLYNEPHYIEHDCPLIEIVEEPIDNTNRNWCLTCQSKEDCEGIDDYSMMTKEQCISGDYCLYCEED